MHHPIDRITHTTAFVTSVVEYWLEREIVQWVTSSVSTPDYETMNRNTLSCFSFQTVHEMGVGVAEI